MSWLSDYEEEKKKKKSTGSSFMDEYNQLKEQETEKSYSPSLLNLKSFYSIDPTSLQPAAETKSTPLSSSSGWSSLMKLMKADELGLTESEFKSELANFKAKAKKDSGTWFTAGGFSDGYQFGDVTKTILGTTGDLLEELGEGIMEMPEQIIDAGAYIAGGIGGLFGADGFKDDMGNFIKKDLYNSEEIIKGNAINQLWKQFGADAEDYSVLGEKADNLATSAGQLAATVGLQYLGVPWWITSGVTSFGSSAEGALNAGASYGVAGVSAAISAGAEILTEKLFGGSGLGEKGLINLDGLTKGISSKAVKALADFGIDMAAEGSEEVVSQFVSTLGQQLTYEKEHTWEELLNDESKMDAYISQVGNALFGKEAREGYRDAWVGGAALGGVMNAGKVSKTIKSGQDYRTGLTANDQKVFDKEYKDRIAEKEKDGKKLSKKDKAEIYDDVLEDMEKGRISTDTIEEVLGGDSYKPYKDSLDAENALNEELKALQTEYDELGKKEKPTLADQARFNELTQQLKDIQTKIDDPNTKAQRDLLKAQLSKDVYELTKSDKLRESYFERVRAGEKFEVDLNQYKGRARDVMQKVMESGLADNTNQTHEFWDWAANMSSSMDTDITLANNEQILEMVKAEHEADGLEFDASKFKGQIIDGYVSKNGIVLNAESKRALNFVVGHEITHKLEGTKHYAKLQELLFEYAKDEYESRFNERAGQYKNKFASDEKFKSKVDKEITGDLVGDYVFNDKGFIDHLTKDQNVFQKVWNEIKYMAKIAKAGSKEAKQLERVKREFERAYREAQKNTTENSGVNFALTGKNKNGVEVYETSQSVMDLTWDERKARYLDVMKNEYRGRTAKFERNGHTYYAKFDQSSIRKPIYGDSRSSTAGVKALIKAGADGDVFDLVENSQYTGSKVNTKTHTNADYFDYFVKTVQIDGKVFDLVADVEKEFGTDEGYVYTLALVDNKTIKASPALGTPNSAPVNSAGNASADNVAQNGANVKYSLSDSDGKQLSKGQQEYFKDSKMRDENGNLKVMYHGSQDAGFHVFDPKMSDDDTSFFFVDRNDVAASYSGTSETYEAKSFNTAEDMNNFLAEIGYDQYEAIEQNGKFELLENGDHVAYSDTAQGIYEEFCWYEGVGDGDANYKVYLNLTNPLEVDAKGRPWNKIDAEFSQEVYDKYQSLTAEEKAALTDLAEWEDFRIFNSEIQEARDNELASAYQKMGEDCNIYDLFSVASENFSEEAMRENARNYLKTRDYAQRAKEQGYDGVIFKNIIDNGGYSNGSEGASTVAIAFDSNQIKSVANDSPTGDADIRYSLSDSKQADNDVKIMDGGSVTKFSLSTWTPETQTKVRDNLIKAGYESDRVDKWITDTNSVASVIAADKDRLDFEAADNQVMLKDNQEYIKTLDASTLCAKRLVYQGTFDAIQHRMPNTMLSSDDLIDLLNMMKKHGVQTPCGVCYVESRRRHLGKFAQDWLNSYNGEYKPNLDEVTTSDGLEALRKSHPQAYKDFVDAMNKKGSSNPKVVQLRTEYRNEILSLTPAQIRKIEAIGGLRVQSFSDFETPHMLDMMQAVMDMSAKGLHSQAYTKVPNFAWVFGDTGIKINLSLIAEGDGFDADGNLAFSSTEGMSLDDAMKLRDAYSQNVGTIIVGANDKHILACMADDRIDFIIPFHRSGWGMKELDMMGMSSYTDYTYGQKEHDLATGKGVENLYPPDYWDYTLSGKENAERYLSLCAKTGREPKFSQFLVNNGDGSYSLQPDGSTDGYWKTLIDFKMYDNEGNGAAQQKVTPNFNMEEAYRVLSEYEGGANKLPVANDVVEEFVAKYQSHKELAPATSVSAIDQQHRNTGGYQYHSHIPSGDIAPIAENVTTESASSALSNANVTQVPDDIAPYEDNWKDAFDALVEDDPYGKKQAAPGTRKALHQGIVDNIKSRFSERGLDFDKVLKKAKNLSTFATVDNTPQRVMEKSLGYKEGQILSDLTVNQVAQNETEGIKWLNSFTDRKSGLLAQISKQYKIKPGSKESAAAQMYAEGFYVDEQNNIVQYGDAELAKDFPDANVQRNIKSLASDPRIRQIYDDTLAMINESRTRNAYPEIPRLDNYFLHFRAMEDTFSRLGLPFNPNDIRAKDLPTDLNGVTADLKPGQPYFASAMHRTGKRTSFDLLGGLERYLTSAKNQIYHIDDIQTLRALRNYVADTYGQANGLEGLDALTEEEAQDRIEKVYNSHLSTFAKFLNEEANILAGKTALIDRGLEGIIGRRGITFLDTVNKQVGSNMVGFNVSSSLTNFLPVAQTFAKSNKVDFVKAFGQTVANKVGSIFGRSDGFTENSPVVIRRKGADRFYRTPYQKVGDAGYVLMSAVDDISTELIARTKYNELTRKGMDSQQAHYETDKWVSRLMGDRSLGQMPQLYNSKMLGLVTKFQLEVRNQLDSQFYDTIQETKASNEDIQNGLARNAKTAAKVASTFVQLAVVQHLFGKAFESVAGYNPAFDIIEVLIKTFGWDDDEESEDTALDNIEQGFLTLLEDLPYTSTLTGGRIPIESALPIEQFIMGEDQYGNEKSRLETLGEVAPYYLLPGGYGQVKKSVQGLSMFDEDHPIAGSYTDSGNLRFPVEDTFGNRLQAGIFGQWASQNAQDYFDNDYAPLKEKQIQEFIDVGLSIQDYWKYREGLSGLKTLAEKADYINSLDLTDEQKNVLINNIADREEAIDMSAYDDYGSFEEFDYAQKNPEKYEFLTSIGVSYEQYSTADEEAKKAYNWAYENPEKFVLSKAVANDVVTYRKYTGELYDIKADKDSNGKSISGSRKEKVIDYINNMDLDYGQRIILFKSEYEADDTYNMDIINYLNSRDDISYEEMETILKELGFNVDSNGNITWD